MAQLHKDYPDVRFVYRHFPLSQHDKSMLAAQATEAAGAQGKFWEMTDLLFAEQSNWVEKSVDDFKTYLNEQAAKLGLDKDKFVADLNSQAIIDKVKKDQQDGEKGSVAYTPFIIFNGRELPEQLPRDYATLSDLINLAKIGDKQFSTCPSMTIDPKKQYTATLKTDKGDIVLQLYPDKAPMAVNSFIFLAKQGWFNGVTFHRVLPGFVAQTGDPTGSGLGGPGYAYSNEISNLRFDKEGVVGMANSGPDTNGSQFFITFAATPNLDGDYTVFGQVIQGMDVARQLTPRDPQSDPSAAPGDKINEVIITEK